MHWQPIDTAPRAWCAPCLGGDYLRSSPGAPNDSGEPLAWEPLYDSAALNAAVAAAVAAERERCAKACTDFALSSPFDEDTRHVIYDCADAIRALPAGGD